MKVPHAFAEAAFVGNCGAGKSTYLLHLEKELEDCGKFTPLHFYLDKTLEADCDYSDLLLWMVGRVAQQFKTYDTPIPEQELVAVADWFAEKSVTDFAEFKRKVEVEAKVEVNV